MSCPVAIFIANEDVDLDRIPNNIFLSLPHRPRVALSRYTRSSSTTSKWTDPHSISSQKEYSGLPNGPAIQRSPLPNRGTPPSLVQIHKTVRR